VIYPRVDLDGEQILDGPAPIALEIYRFYDRASFRVIWDIPVYLRPSNIIKDELERSPDERRLIDFLERLGFEPLLLEARLHDVIYGDRFFWTRASMYPKDPIIADIEATPTLFENLG